MFTNERKKNLRRSKKMLQYHGRNICSSLFFDRFGDETGGDTLDIRLSHETMFATETYELCTMQTTNSGNALRQQFCVI